MIGDDLAELLEINVCVLLESVVYVKPDGNSLFEQLMEGCKGVKCLLEL